MMFPVALVQLWQLSISAFSFVFLYSFFFFVFTKIWRCPFPAKMILLLIACLLALAANVAAYLK